MTQHSAALAGMVGGVMALAGTWAGMTGRSDTIPAVGLGGRSPVVVSATVHGKVLPGRTVTVTPQVDAADGSIPVRASWRQHQGVPAGLVQPLEPHPAFHLVDQDARHKRFEADTIEVTLPWSWRGSHWTSAGSNSVVLELMVQTTSGEYRKLVEIAAAEPLAIR